MTEIVPLATSTKDPGAVLDYTLDWSEWLSTGELIATSSWTVPSGLTMDSEEIVTGSLQTLVWLSGGTAGKDYYITNTITTDGDRTDERTLLIQVRDR